MAEWRVSAALAVLVVAAFVGGAGVRALELVDNGPAVVSLVVLAAAVVTAVGLGTRVRRLSTPYW